MRLIRPTDILLRDLKSSEMLLNFLYEITDITSQLH